MKAAAQMAKPKCPDQDAEYHAPPHLLNRCVEDPHNARSGAFCSFTPITHISMVDQAQQQDVEMTARPGGISIKTNGKAVVPVTMKHTFTGKSRMVRGYQWSLGSRKRSTKPPTPNIYPPQYNTQSSAVVASSINQCNAKTISSQQEINQAQGANP